MTTTSLDHASLSQVLTRTTEAVVLPPHVVAEPDRMRRLIGRAERRTRQRFPGEPADSIRCDPHAYRRLLRVDLAAARVGLRVLRSRRSDPIDHGSQASGGVPR